MAETKIDRGPIVIYCSETGFTAKYALWIAEKLECPFITIKEAHVGALQHYETLIFGGWILGGQIQGLDFLKKNFDKFEGQNVAVFCTGSGKKQDLKKLREDNFTPAMANVPLYAYKGGLNYDKMKLMHRGMMKMFAKALKARGLTAEYDRITHNFDETDPAYVDELVERVKNHEFN